MGDGGTGNGPALGHLSILAAGPCLEEKLLAHGCKHKECVRPGPPAGAHLFPSRGLSADTRANCLWTKPAGVGQLLPGHSGGPEYPRKGADPDSNPSSTANLAGNLAFSLGPYSTASLFRVGVGQFYCCPHQPAGENHTKTVSEGLSEQVFPVGGRGFPKGKRHPPSSISPSPRRRPGPGRLCRPGSWLPVKRTWADQLWPRLPVPPQDTGANTFSWGLRLAPDSLSSLQGPVFPLLTSLLGSAWPRLSTGSPPCAGSWGAWYGVGVTQGYRP